MQELCVIDVMNPTVITISDEAVLSEAVTMLEKHRISALVVVDHAGHMAGVLSQTDVLRAWQTSDAGDAVEHQAVARHMTRDVISVAPHKPLSYALRLLHKHQIRRLVVVETRDGGRFVTDRIKPIGILSQTDIVRALTSKAEELEVAAT
jgi:CBS domain-containing protein